MQYVVTACSPSSEVPAAVYTTLAGAIMYVRSASPENVDFFDEADAFCGWKIYEVTGINGWPTRIAFACWDGTNDVSPFYTPEELEDRKCRSI